MYICKKMKKVAFISSSFPKFMNISWFISVLSSYSASKPHVFSHKIVSRCSPSTTAAITYKQSENKMGFSTLLKSFPVTLFNHTLTELLCKLLQTTQQLIRHRFYV